MSPNRNAVGPVLGAILAIAAVMAPSAAATSTYHLTSSAEHTTLGGGSVGTHEFKVDAGTATCKTVDYAGTLPEDEVVEVSLTPTYTECTGDPLGGPVDISMNSCKFVLTPSEAESSIEKANIALSCEAGKSVKVEVTLLGVIKCTIHISAQELGQVSVSEVSGDDVTVGAEVSGIEYTQTAGSGLGACATGAKTNGTYKGHATINGGEAALSLDQIPRRIRILSNPVEFKKLNDPVEFEVESLETKKIIIGFFLNPRDNTKMLKITGGCLGTGGVFNNMGDKCKEKIECTKASNDPTLELGVITDPVGGDVVKLKGC